MTPPSLTLVTGATGFVGAAVALHLEQAGFKLRVMHRANANLSNLDLLQAERVTADLNDTASLASAVSGCEALFHVAADYRLWARRPAELYDTNVDGTMALLRAAQTAGVKRCVYTSSVATIRVFADGSVSNEQEPTTIADMIGHYKRSKFLAEQQVSEFAADAEMEIVIVNPSTPIGPRDIRPTPTGKIVVDAAAGRIPAYVDTGLNVVHVDDVAQGHLLAYQHGQRGRRYILGGTDMTLRDILAHVCVAAGRKPPQIRLPHRLLYPLAYAVEGWAHLTRTDREPMVTVDGLRMSEHQMYFSSERARQELHYVSRCPTEALDDALNWFDANGYL